MKKTLLQEVKQMNRIAGTQMTKEQEIAFIKERLNELEFDSQKELDAYKKAHKVRKGTQLKVRSTTDKIGNALNKGFSKVEKGLDKFSKTKVGKKLDKGLDWIAKKVQSLPE